VTQITSLKLTNTNLSKELEHAKAESIKPWTSISEKLQDMTLELKQNTKAVNRFVQTNNQRARND
jgi:hypothetical protein